MWRITALLVFCTWHAASGSSSIQCPAPTATAIDIVQALNGSRFTPDKVLAVADVRGIAPRVKLPCLGPWIRRTMKEKPFLYGPYSSLLTKGLSNLFNVASVACDGMSCSTSLLELKSKNQDVMYTVVKSSHAILQSTLVAIRAHRYARRFPANASKLIGTYVDRRFQHTVRTEYSKLIKVVDATKTIATEAQDSIRQVAAEEGSTSTSDKQQVRTIKNTLRTLETKISRHQGEERTAGRELRNLKDQLQGLKDRKTDLEDEKETFEICDDRRRRMNRQYRREYDMAVTNATNRINVKNSECSKLSQRVEWIKKELAKVHGGWGTWSAFGTCSQTCGSGVQTRKRKCDSPKPKNGGRFCEGEMIDTKTCASTPCDTSCRSGSSNCVFPYTYNGKTCAGPNCCNLSNNRGGAWCVTNPGGAYVTGKWEYCKGPCKDTECTRTEAGDCCKASFKYGSGFNSQTYTDCTLDGTDTGKPWCYTVDGSSDYWGHCKSVDGAWGEWSEYSECSATCGSEGTQKRTRICDSPAPKYGGRECEGDATQTKQCNNGTCQDEVCGVRPDGERCCQHLTDFRGDKLFKCADDGNCASNINGTELGPCVPYDERKRRSVSGGDLRDELDEKQRKLVTCMQDKRDLEDAKRNIEKKRAPSCDPWTDQNTLDGLPAEIETTTQKIQEMTNVKRKAKRNLAAANKEKELNTRRLGFVEYRIKKNEDSVRRLRSAEESIRLAGEVLCVIRKMVVNVKDVPSQIVSSTELQSMAEEEVKKRIVQSGYNWLAYAVAVNEGRKSLEDSKQRATEVFTASRSTNEQKQSLVAEADKLLPIVRKHLESLENKHQLTCSP